MDLSFRRCSLIARPLGAVWLAACAPQPTSTATQSTAAPTRAPGPSSKAEPPATAAPIVLGFSPLPQGWSYSCAALSCTTQLALDAQASPGARWYNSTPSAPIDIGLLAADLPTCKRESPAPETCAVQADFDGDGAADLITPILGETFEPGFAIAWGDGREMSTIGPSDGGHLAAVAEPGTCATALQEALPYNSVRRVEDLVEVEGATVTTGSATRHRRSAIRLPEGTLLGFDGLRWRVATPERQAVKQSPQWTAPWTQTALPPQCSRARAIRKTRYKRHALLQWHPSDQVARDLCTHTIDFDNDGTKELVSWVVQDGMPGLQIAGLAKGTALFGAGRHSAFRTLDGEPGCHSSPASLDDVWHVAPAEWTGTEWKLENGRTYAPASTQLVDGPALALTNAFGHVDLLFLSRGEWRTAAVPFEWERHFVLWPAMDQWNWSPKPLPLTRRYVRPHPASHDWVKTHTPGPRPKDAGRFYPGH